MKFIKLVLLMIIAGALGAACVDDKFVDQSDMIDVYAERMQDFVQDISEYARGLKPGFMIIPQNGIELAFNETDLSEGLMDDYLKSIDGVGIEELFYNGSLNVDNERLEMLKFLKKSKPSIAIMVSDYVSNNANMIDARDRNTANNFIAFPRSSDNREYELVPGLASGNLKNINTLSDAENYLYLISTTRFANKDAMLDAIRGTNYDVVIMDLFFNKAALTPDDIASLKTKHNGAKRLVISYISIGSAENYRYYWKSGWKIGSPSWIKKRYSARYPDEFWVEFWHPEWKDIILYKSDSYIRRIINAGFDGAYLDNVEAYYFLVKSM